MDSEKPKNKAKLMKKRNVRSVHEHFEEVLTQLSGFVAFMPWPHLGEAGITGVPTFTSAF